jgi:hypothetical protein
MSDLRARSNAELLDAAFEIYRRHFAIFLAVGVVAALPMALVQYTSLSLLGGKRGAMTIPDVSGGSFVMLQVMMLVAYVVTLFITPFTEGITVTTAARAYRGESVELGDATRAVFSRPVAVLLAYWARFFLIMAAMMAIGIVGSIVVGIVFAVFRPLGILLAIPLVIGMFVAAVVIWKRYFAVLPVLLVEEKRVADSMSRSRALADGNGARIVVLIGLVILISMFFGIMLGGIAAALISGVVGALLYLFCVALVNQFAGVVLTLLYFDLRIRKEGYDIELLASSLDPTPAALPANTPPPTTPPGVAATA